MAQILPKPPTIVPVPEGWSVAMFQATVATIFMLVLFLIFLGLSYKTKHRVYKTLAVITGIGFIFSLFAVFLYYTGIF